MAELLSEEIDTKPAPFIGHQLLNVITMGMYDDPLMIYREYVQNAVDSIDAALEEGKIVIGQGRISIQINGDNRSIRIEDNGAGLPRSSAPEFLLNLGHSVKDGSGRRGFRGIGRLGGLAYCQLLRFETRSSEGEEVTVVEWNKGCLDALPESTKRDVGLTGVVREITRVYSRKPSSNDSDHFFRVEMQNVRRFHSDRLMGVRVVRDYLSQVAPVSYDKANFCHADKVENHFAVVPGYRSYEITVNDRKVTRPYSDKIDISANSVEKIRDVELFELSGNRGTLARGWYAVMDYKGSLPSNLTMRGIRVRHGNIEVGDEYFLASLYLERRFATWTIGEIHISDCNIKPNARRDGFEQTPEYEAFLERTTVLGRFLSQLCRKSSNQRSRHQTLVNRLQEINTTLASVTFFIDQKHQQGLREALHQKLEQVRALMDASGNRTFHEEYQELLIRIESLDRTIPLFDDCLDGRSIRHVEKAEIIGKMLEILYREFRNSTSIEDLMGKALMPFLKPRFKEHLSQPNKTEIGGSTDLIADR